MESRREGTSNAKQPGVPDRAGQSGKQAAGTSEQNLGGQRDGGQYGQVGKAPATTDNSKAGKRIEEQSRKAVQAQDAKRDDFASGKKRFTEGK